MREAIGGSFLFYIIIIFLGIYIAVLMFALAYVKAFKVKNQVISIIEVNEGYTQTAQDEINRYFDRNNQSLNVGPRFCRNNEAYNENGFCISAYRRANRTTYTVRTAIILDIPIIREFVGMFGFSVSGETIAIYEGMKTNR